MAYIVSAAWSSIVIRTPVFASEKEDGATRHWAEWCDEEWKHLVKWCGGDCVKWKKMEFKRQCGS